jgi:autotransporter-associated beta strand protein
LLKTGTGVLELAAANTYAGNTLILGGSLLATNASGSATGTGTVRVGAGATLGGTGTVAPAGTNAVVVLPGGTLRGGDGTGIGTLTVNGTSDILMADGSRLAVRIVAAGTPSPGSGGSTAGTLPNPTNHSYLNSTAGLSANPLALNFLIDGTGAGFVVNQTYSYQIGQVNENLAVLPPFNPSQFVAVGFQATNFAITGNSSGAIFLTFTPVPEPGAVLAVGAFGLGLFGWVIRAQGERLWRHLAV